MPIMIIMILLCCLLFRLGGWGKVKFLFLFNAKWWRWIGVPYTIAAFNQNMWLIPLYYIAVNVPYGDNSWIKKYVGRELNWVLYGCFFGFCSIPVLGFTMGLLQGVMGGLTFSFLMHLSNDGVNRGSHMWYMGHKWVELLFPIGGLLLYMGR